MQKDNNIKENDNIEEDDVQAIERLGRAFRQFKVSIKQGPQALRQRGIQQATAGSDHCVRQFYCHTLRPYLVPHAQTR